MFGAKVGKGVVIKPSVNIKFPWKLKIGDHSWIGEGVWIDNLSDVIIGGHVALSQGCLLLTGSHDHRRETFDFLSAPIVLEERVSDYFELDRPSPYMLLVADVVPERRVPKKGDEEGLPLVEWVNRPRSDVPAITHVDYSARIQTVSREENPRYHALIGEFEQLTGYGVIVNTSFNVRGEPIVCTPEDAYRCFMRTEMDYLVLGPFLIDKQAQPQLAERYDWRNEYKLD